MAKTIKMILIGDATVGKTTLRHKYLGVTPKNTYLPTIGADFAVKQVTFQDQDYLIQIWDFAGQEDFLPLRRAYYKNTTCAFLLFDLTNHESFNNLSKWIDEMTSNLKKNIPFIILGNKVDLVENNGSIPKTKIKSYISSISRKFEYDVPYFETSALQGENVNLAFDSILSMINEVG